MDMVKSRSYSFGILAALILFPSLCNASADVAPEVIAAAPQGTRLISFRSSGPQSDADAIAVYETAPDQEGVRHRDLVVFRRKSGKFIPEIRSGKIIACSKCSQFHDDPFDDGNVGVTPGRIHIEQMDGGEKPSTTILDFVRKADAWRVTEATRITVEEGRGEQVTEKLPLPASGLMQDMDARWSVPTFFNAVVVNDKTHKFAFLHGSRTPAELEKSIAMSCRDGSDCRVLVRQQDGCMSLVRDEKLRAFAVGIQGSKDKQNAVALALAKCRVEGNGKCEEVRTDCSTGVL